MLPCWMLSLCYCNSFPLFAIIVNLRNFI
uniref:Uncharacterized protein n=1 Tax=Arundo donax TaxID=35708 RepID=A0A0A9BST2_ARUDO